MKNLENEKIWCGVVKKRIKNLEKWKNIFIYNVMEWKMFKKKIIIKYEISCRQNWNEKNIQNFPEYKFK